MYQNICHAHQYPFPSALRDMFHVKNYEMELLQFSLEMFEHVTMKRD